MEDRIGKLLRAANLKLALAESCTGGLVSHRITNVPGSSEYYLGSVTGYSDEAKRLILNVDPVTLVQYGAVSRETVLEMADGVRKIFAGSEIPLERVIGMSVSGIAGPGGGMPEKPVGLVWIGLSAADGHWAWRYLWSGDRVKNKELSAQQLLDLLGSYLNRNMPPEDL